MAALQPLKYLVVEASAKHTATVIFVHGLGDTGAGWKPVADMLKKNSLQHVKWVLPHAPIRPITANNGVEMPAWYATSLTDSSNKLEEDESNMLQAVRGLNTLISTEIDNGIPASRIVLGGFSQGGATSLLTGLTSERKIGGIACLSGWLPLKHKFKAMASDHAKLIPIFWGHGTHDPLVRFDMATASTQFLKRDLGVKTATNEDQVGLSFHSYEGEGHTACIEELGDLQAWLKRVISEAN
ncbi:Phospholipase/carboxylesterase [Phellopilus nigrolimitatus]|nr:Phospholipase/carboxylesterase [Phellopilus nigrolimitatus]